MDRLRRWLIRGPFRLWGSSWFHVFTEVPRFRRRYAWMCVPIISCSLNVTRAARNCRVVACEPQYPKLMITPTVRRRGWRPGLRIKPLGAGQFSVLCLAGCSAPLASPHEMPGAPSTQCDNQKCLHTLPNVPGRTLDSPGSSLCGLEHRNHFIFLSLCPHR